MNGGKHLHDCAKRKNTTPFKNGLQIKSYSCQEEIPCSFCLINKQINNTLAHTGKNISGLKNTTQSPGPLWNNLYKKIVYICKKKLLKNLTISTFG